MTELWWTCSRCLAALALKAGAAQSAAPSGITLSQAGATVGTQVGNFGTRTIGSVTPATSLHVGTYHKPVTAGGTGAPSMTATGGTGSTQVGGTAGFIRLRAVASNAAPTANAGADQSKTVGQVVTLDSSASTDPDGTITSRVWSKASGPTLIGALSSTTATFPTYTATAAGTDVWRVTVTDNGGLTDFDDVSIVIAAGDSAGGSASKTSPAAWETVTITGTGSGTGAWTQTSGSTVTLGGSGAVRTFEAVPSNTPGATAVRQFTYTVGTATAVVTITTASGVNFTLTASGLRAVRETA